MPAGTPLAATSEATGQVEARLNQVPEVDQVFTTVGESGSRYAQLLVMLKDKNHRQRGSQEIADEARSLGQDIPGMTLKAVAVSSLGGSGADGAIQVQIQGDDQKVLASLAKQVAGIDPEANLLLQPAASTAIMPADIKAGGSLGSILTMPNRRLARHAASTKPLSPSRKNCPFRSQLR